MIIRLFIGFCGVVRMNIRLVFSVMIVVLISISLWFRWFDRKFIGNCVSVFVSIGMLVNSVILLSVSFVCVV